MPITRGRKLGTPLMPEPKENATSHRYLLVIGVERCEDQPLPPVADATKVIEAAIEAGDLTNPDSGMTWRVSYVGHV